MLFPLYSSWVASSGADDVPTTLHAGRTWTAVDCALGGNGYVPRLPTSRMVAVFDTVTSSVGKLVVGSLQVVELVREIDWHNGSKGESDGSCSQPLEPRRDSYRMKGVLVFNEENYNRFSATIVSECRLTRKRWTLTTAGSSVARRLAVSGAPATTVVGCRHGVGVELVVLRAGRWPVSGRTRPSVIRAWRRPPFWPCPGCTATADAGRGSRLCKPIPFVAGELPTHGLLVALGVGCRHRRHCGVGVTTAAALGRARSLIRVFCPWSSGAVGGGLPS